jgi:uncharacterized repeat protein (TIGR01451 family)
VSRVSGSKALLMRGWYGGSIGWVFAQLVTFVVCVVACLGWSGVAGASLVWRIDSLAASTAAPGTTLNYTVEVRNVGDSGSDGSPVTVRALLPAGLSAVNASMVHISSFEFVSCTADNGVDPVSGLSSVRCVLSAPFDLQDAAQLFVSATVDPGVVVGSTVVSEFRVFGGGGASAGTVDPTRVGGLPGFGIEAFDGLITGDASGGLSTQAGAHPFAVTTAIDFNTRDNRSPLVGGAYPIEAVKDVIVDLPPGLVGDPTGVAQCTLAELANAAGVDAKPLCAPASQVGTADVRFANPAGHVYTLPVFNITPPPGVPARFGFNAIGTVVVLDAGVRSGSDYGLKVTAHNAPEGVGVAGTTVRFWGVPAAAVHDPERACPNQSAPSLGGGHCSSGAPQTAFLRNPTSCTPPGVGLAWTARADSWVHPGVFVEASFVSHDPLGYPFPPSDWGLQRGTEGCERVPFDPTLVGTPDPPAKTGAPSGFTFDLSIPQTDVPSAIAQSDLRTAVVTLPEGVRVSPSSAHGLGACTPAQVGLGNESEPACPDSSRIGSVTVETPLLPDPLTGSVFLASPHENPFGSLLAVYLVVRGPGVTIKLAGHVISDADTGQLSTVFDENPQLPFSRLHLVFNGGPTAPLTLPRQCGTYTTTSVLTSWSGKIVPANSTFTVSHDGQGAPCPAPQFSPTFTAGSENPLAGATSPLHLTFSRDDDDEEFASVVVNMPNGLTGKIANVDLCPETNARTGTCTDGSRIGRVTVGAGAGSDPFYIDTGRAYLTGPYKSAPYGIAIVVPAVAGPFNLGNVVVRSAVFVDKHTAELRVVSDPLPRILEGIPLDVRDVRVSVDRPNFTLNPTSCAKKTITGTLTSTAGKTANVSSRFQVGDCASLPFKPRFGLTVGSSGHTARNATVPLTTTLTMPPRSANLRYVRVTLPTTINARLTVINRACTRAVYEAGHCEAARAGTAVANTPLLKDPLHGNVYFVKNGHPLPDLFIALRGQVDFDLIGRISIPNSRFLATTFDAIPDVPVKSFTLKLAPGARGTVGAATNLCSKRGRNEKAQLDFIGQNGRVSQRDQRLTIRGCGTTAHKNRHRKR